MPQSILSVKDVAACLHVSPREVVRLAECRILPGKKVRGQWQFRAGEVWNWVEANLETLPARRERDRHPEPRPVALITPVLREAAVAIDVVAKTRSSILRELARLAAVTESSIMEGNLAELLLERESIGSTALQDGVAIPHPSRPLYAEGPVISAARTAQGIVFGQRDGGLTDLFFMVCCPTQTEHLLYLGRLCRILIDPALLARLRLAASPRAFLDALAAAETRLCQS